MIRVAIVGCGRIADQHVHAIHRIPESTVVAVCDREPLMARQLAERFSIAACFEDVEDMLRTITPDVVHITTPPQSHCDLGQRCLRAGSHVYLEKPFTVTASEAESLILLAQSSGRSVTAGHNYQFTPEMMEMRQLVREGFLGGNPAHLESYWSYDLGDVDYVGPMLADPNHWVRRLPGQLFHNLISHGIARLAEFLDDELTELICTMHQSSYLHSLGVEDVADELRVIIRDKKGTSAFFCFSTQIKPSLNSFHIYGPLNSMTADLVTGSLIRNSGKSYKSYLTFLVPPLNSMRAHFRSARRNAVNIFRQRLYQDSGMKELVQRFHESIATGNPPPIPYREIQLTARILDEIFSQSRTNARKNPTKDKIGT